MKCTILINNDQSTSFLVPSNPEVTLPLTFDNSAIKEGLANLFPNTDDLQAVAEILGNLVAFYIFATTSSEQEAHEMVSTIKYTITFEDS